MDLNAGEGEEEERRLSGRKTEFAFGAPACTERCAGE
jgi:hypothetical protein